MNYSFVLTIIFGMFRISGNTIDQQKLGIGRNNSKGRLYSLFSKNKHY